MQNVRSHKRLRFIPNLWVVLTVWTDNYGSIFPHICRANGGNIYSFIYSRSCFVTPKLFGAPVAQLDAPLISDWTSFEACWLDGFGNLQSTMGEFLLIDWVISSLARIISSNWMPISWQTRKEGKLIVLSVVIEPWSVIQPNTYTSPVKWLSIHSLAMEFFKIFEVPCGNQPDICVFEKIVR